MKLTVHENVKEPINNEIPKSDKYGLLILLVVYTFQSTTLGFMAGALVPILSEGGAKFSDLGCLSLITLPLSAKFFLAPILDTYYSKTFGKRKTFLVPAQYLHGALALILSFYIEQWIRNFNVFLLAGFGFLLAFCVSVQDTSLDGWFVTLLSEKSIPYFSTVQSIGSTLGTLLGNQLIITLSSVEFCNQYIFSVPHEKPIVTLRGFFFCLGLAMISANFLIHMLVRERNPQSTEAPSIKAVFRMLGGFWKNPNLRLLCFFILSFRLVYGPVDCSAGVILIQKGFSKQYLSAIQICGLPIQFIIAVVAGSVSAKKQEFKMILVCGVIKIAENMTWFRMATYFDPKTNYGQTFMVLLFLQMFSNVINGLLFVSLGGFFGRISAEENGGTFTTCLSSFINLGDLWVKMYCFNMLGYISLPNLALACWLYGGLYYFVIGSSLFKLQSLDKTSFSPFPQVKDDITIISSPTAKYKDL